MEKPQLSWREFEELLYKRFGNQTGRDVVEEFNKIQ